MKQTPSSVHLASRVEGLPETVFSEFSALAKQHGAVNLGQGFPDFDGPPEILDAAVRAIQGGENQYAVGAGSADLRKAICEHSLRFYGMRVDPDSMVSVTSGATEALFDALLGLVDPGDEVILFEPFYDSYAAGVAMAGGVPRFVQLRPPDASHPEWWFREEELANAFSARTRVVLVNTPHNPTGKVFTRDELGLIARLCIRHDVVALADEVYEHIVFAPAVHVRLATLPGMEARTITVSSGGKSFSVTGWKVGWAIAAPPLRKAVQQTHQFVTFATAAPLQSAIAFALRLPDGFFAKLAEDYLKRRDALLSILRTSGLPAAVPQGAYFVLSDVGALGWSDDRVFCRALTERTRVAAIPLSAFVHPGSELRPQVFARFAFCKTDATLQAAQERLRQLPSP